MTFIMVLLLGAGTLFISSSLDCTPIASTFQKIVRGEQVDWSGQNCSSSPIEFHWGYPLTPGPGGTLLGPGIQLPNPDGSCPPGFHSIRGSAGNLLCQKD